MINNSPLVQKAHNLAHFVYDLTYKFPKDELFGLVSQIRRAIISVVSNIVEGFARGKYKVVTNHLEIAYGSLMETKYQLYFSCQRGFITREEYLKFWEDCEEIAKMIWKSKETLKNK